ncbi:MAG TPA: rod shape-determining protein MreC [Syntrophorhabdaceae bacterium]|nr:rod shape-determining protein MreC [Syntrophorhabdaceae bacterium]
MRNSIAIVIAILVLVISFLSFTNAPFVARSFASVKNGLNSFLGPALNVVSKPVEAISGGLGSYFNLVGAKKENEELKSKVDKLFLENQRLAELERENARLRKLLNFTEKKPNTMIAAVVIGEDLKNWFRCIIIDKGKKHNIREKTPVVTPRGIVGQVVEVDLWHSKVMVLNDTNSSIDVNIEGKNTRGLLEGTGQNTLKLKYVIKNDDIEIGDKLSTSGKDGIYPKGIPVGIVITANKNKAGIFADIDVMPFNNFKQLDEVLLIKK